MKTALYGIKNSNHDMSEKVHWGKNEFATSFPMSVAIFEDESGNQPVYIKVDSNLNVEHSYISLNNAFGIDNSVQHSDLKFDFESFADLDEELNGKGSGNSTRSDVIVYQIKENKKIGRSYGMEIKLTTVPDNSTVNSEHDNQSSEIVIRPVSILHLSNILANNFADKKDRLTEMLEPITKIFSTNEKWGNLDLVKRNLSNFVDAFKKILLETVEQQQPVLMQCIWRTHGKQPLLEDNAFETFFWSSHAFSKLFLEKINATRESKSKKNSLDRKTRAMIWVIRMLCEYVDTNHIPGEDLIHSLSYGNQTDKAFAANGKITLPFLKCKELSKPRVLGTDLDQIVLGDGKKYLSPERRLDETLYIQTLFNDKERE